MLTSHPKYFVDSDRTSKRYSSYLRRPSMHESTFLVDVTLEPGEFVCGTIFDTKTLGLVVQSNADDVTVLWSPVEKRR